jgi:hypothetical protein
MLVEPRKTCTRQSATQQKSENWHEQNKNQEKETQNSLLRNMKESEIDIRGGKKT